MKEKVFCRKHHCEALCEGTSTECQKCIEPCKFAGAYKPNSNGMDILKALTYAKDIHKGQKYGDEDYFECHIQGVRKNLYWPYDVTTEIMAILHDTIEDTKLNPDDVFKDIRNNWGKRVAAGVLTLTKRKEETYASYILRIGECNDLAVLDVKLADLEFNITQSCLIKNATGYERQRLEKYKLARMYLNQVKWSKKK